MKGLSFLKILAAVIALAALHHFLTMPSGLQLPDMAAVFAHRFWQKVLSLSVFTRYLTTGGKPMELLRANLASLNLDPPPSNYDHIETVWETIAGVPVLIHAPVMQNSSSTKLKSETIASASKPNTKAPDACNKDNFAARDCMPRRRAIIYYHGGGWGIGSAKFTRFLSEEIAAQTGAIVFNVEYRLAPPHFYPKGFDDCVAVTRYVVENAEKLNVNVDDVVLLGDSAGANLVAAVSLYLRDNNYTVPGTAKAFMPKKQILVYPVLQGATFRTVSHIRHAAEPVSNAYGVAFAFLNYAGMSAPTMSQVQCYTENGFLDIAEPSAEFKHVQKYFEKYVVRIYPGFNFPAINMTWLMEKFHIPDMSAWLGNGNSSEQSAAGTSADNKTIIKSCGFSDVVRQTILNPYVSPIMAPSLKNLPHTVIFTAELDGLRDDGLMFSDRLRDDGVRADTKNFLCLHGALFDYRWLKCGQEMLEDLLTELRSD